MGKKSALPFIGLGLFLIAIGATSILTGSVPLYRAGDISLDEAPQFFWLVEGIYLLSGLVLISIGAWRYLRR